MIEGSIFLDENDHMFDIRQITAASGRTGKNDGITADGAAAM
jgi:hypothetical protein